MFRPNLTIRWPHSQIIMLSPRRWPHSQIIILSPRTSLVAKPTDGMTKTGSGGNPVAMPLVGMAKTVRGSTTGTPMGGMITGASGGTTGIPMDEMITGASGETTGIPMDGTITGASGDNLVLQSLKGIVQ